MVNGKNHEVFSPYLEDGSNDHLRKNRDVVRNKKSKPRKGEMMTPSPLPNLISSNPNSKATWNGRDDVDDSPRETPNSRERVQDGQDAVNERRNPTKSKTSVFHVRISVWYMAGLRIDRTNKRAKQPINNRITVGFVELASSGKYTALSQPILTNFEEKVNITNILWATERDGGGVSKSTSRRRLHFSLQLEKEDMRDNNCDNSVDSQASFLPEAVKLLVGLKCGDERIPLGIAKLVVDGKESADQIVNLDVVPIISLANGSKSKRGLFGKKQLNAFTGGDLIYRLDPSATLRVKTDVKTGYPGQEGAEIWGNDDSSYKTGLAPFSSSPTCGLNFKTMKISPEKGGDGKTQSNNVLKKKTHTSERIDRSMQIGSQRSPRNRQQRRQRAPVPFIAVDAVDTSHELVSVLSGTSDHGCDIPWSCSPICCREEMPRTHIGNIFPRSFTFESQEDSLRDEVPPFDMSAEKSWNYAKQLLSGNKTQKRKYRMLKL
eukprot:jgi/Psemu1/284761/fgenesh1_pg.63_\